MFAGSLSSLREKSVFDHEVDSDILGPGFFASAIHSIEGGGGIFFGPCGFIGRVGVFVPGVVGDKCAAAMAS